MDRAPELIGASAATALAGDLSDEELVRQVRGGEARWFEAFVRRFNQRLFRTARAILKDDAAAEDVVQETYIRAFMHLDQFEGRSSVATWLTRIAVNEAIARRRKAGGPWTDRAAVADDDAVSSVDPEVLALRGEVLTVLSSLVDELPDGLRTVFVMRAVEGMSVADTATALAISEENVKVRLFRARAVLRARLGVAFDEVVGQIFAFHLARCDRIVRGVLLRTLRPRVVNAAPSPPA